MDGTYLRMINEGRRSLKGNKSSFIHSGSTSSIFTNCGNPNLNLMAFNDMHKTPEHAKGVFHTLPTVSPDGAISPKNGKDAGNYTKEYRASSKLSRDLLPPA